jgi:hypothetical protein
MFTCLLSFDMSFVATAMNNPGEGTDRPPEPELQRLSPETVDPFSREVGREVMRSDIGDSVIVILSLSR